MGCLDDLERKLNIKPLLLCSYNNAENSHEENSSCESAEIEEENIETNYEDVEPNYEYIAKNLEVSTKNVCDLYNQIINTRKRYENYTNEQSIKIVNYCDKIIHDLVVCKISKEELNQTVNEINALLF